MLEAHDEPRPPQPPHMSRRVRLSLGLTIGIPLLVVLLVLVCRQVFGERMEDAVITVGTVEANVRFPSRLRETMRSAIRIELHNTGDTAVRDMTIRFDPAYLGHFGELMFTPAADSSYVVTVPELSPDDRRRIVVEVRAHKLGRQSGRLTIHLPDSDAQGEIELHTFTFP